METFVSNDYIEISYDSAHQLLFSAWQANPTTFEFKEAMNAHIEAFEKYGTGILVSDTSDLGATAPEDQEWVNAEWMPNAIKAGYKKAAFIVSPDIFTKMSVDDIVSASRELFPEVELQYFPSVAEGMEWAKKNKA
ncbi:MAG: hypothetical protein LAT68_05380 [Cyclobacteriaceae bacterium]|nr:hypothetical protein [Cyclobacteriaceae bacterium]MCH8515742.1 hypothetical protein [Cyclobacteriaceae bacterium]